MGQSQSADASEGHNSTVNGTEQTIDYYRLLGLDRDATDEESVKTSDI
jgi:hypothetical protein